MDRKMKQRSPYLEKTGIQLIEESTYAFRTTPAKALLLYYTGSMPFVLGLLYFWGDMSRNAYAYQYCAAASLALTLLFIWMKSWHTVFALYMRSQIGNKEPIQWSVRRMARLVAAQTIIQPTGFLILPLSMLMVLPFGWVFAFYQNIAAYDFHGPLRITSVIRRYSHQAKLWPRQNHILLAVFFIFSLFVFLNIAMAILILPFFLKKFFGVNTLFTLSGFSMLNTTFLIVACGMTYLCIDPFIKIAYTLRCFYGASLTSGDDLKADLKHIRLLKKTTPILFIVLLISPLFQYSYAAVSAKPTPLRAFVSSPDKLDQSIQEVLNRREFSWRLPREKIIRHQPEPFNPFSAFWKWIKPYLKKMLNPLSSIIKKIVDWLKHLIPEKDVKPLPSNLNWMTKTQTLFFVFLCIVASTLVIYLRRIWQRRKRTKPASSDRGIEISLDLTDDRINADDLPVDRWLHLAKELTQKGEFRLALRAVYLAILAALAEADMILIAKHKSNRDYEAELKRRAHERKDLIRIFSTCVSFFDKAWYGMGRVTASDVTLFSSNFKQIAAFAKH